MTIQFTAISGLLFACERLSQSRYDVHIQGPQGGVCVRDIGWHPVEYYQDYPDRLWELYYLALSITAGVYHCCLSGKVDLYL